MAPTGSGPTERFLRLTCSHLETVEVVFRNRPWLHASIYVNGRYTASRDQKPACSMRCCGCDLLLHAADVMKSRSQPARGQGNAARDPSLIAHRAACPFAEGCVDCSLMLLMPD